MYFLNTRKANIMEIWNLFFIEIRNLDSHKRSVSCIFLGQYQIQAPPRVAPLFSLISLCSMWDLSSLTRDWTWAPWMESTVLTTEPPEKSQGLPFKGTHTCFFFFLLWWVGIPGGAVVKNLHAKAGDARDTGLIPGLGTSPGEGDDTPLSVLAWKISWAEEPGGLQSMGLQRVGHDWVA